MQCKVVRDTVPADIKVKLIAKMACFSFLHQPNAEGYSNTGGFYKIRNSTWDKIAAELGLPNAKKIWRNIQINYNRQNNKHFNASNVSVYNAMQVLRLHQKNITTIPIGDVNPNDFSPLEKRRQEAESQFMKIFNKLQDEYIFSLIKELDEITNQFQATDGVPEKIEEASVEETQPVVEAWKLEPEIQIQELSVENTSETTSHEDPPKKHQDQDDNENVPAINIENMNETTSNKDLSKKQQDDGQEDDCIMYVPFVETIDITNKNYVPTIDVENYRLIQVKKEKIDNQEENVNQGKKRKCNYATARKAKKSKHVEEFEFYQ